jgi:hypothetical protein
VFVPAHSLLDGVPVGDIDAAEAMRVIAVTEFGEPRPLWHPVPGRRIKARDRLTVVATRQGLTDLLDRAATQHG